MYAIYVYRGSKFLVMGSKRYTTKDEAIPVAKQIAKHYGNKAYTMIKVA